MSEFICNDCGATFLLPRRVLARYPGWTPRRCAECRDQECDPPALTKQIQSPPSLRSSSKASRQRLRTADLVLTTDEVLARFTDGPQDGVFTDGSSVPNPGPGGWGVVYVAGGQVVSERHGHEPETTNNRMELTALIQAVKLVPSGKSAVVYSDSRLSVSTITEWAAGWEARGWRRKSGPVENLDLVVTAYRLFLSRSELSLKWIPAHSGYKWNEYADALASRWRLDLL